MFDRSQILRNKDVIQHREIPHFSDGRNLAGILHSFEGRGVFIYRDDMRFPLQTSLAPRNPRSTGSDIATNHEENYQIRAVYSKSIFK